MNEFVRNGITYAMKDVEHRYEIAEVLKEITSDIEIWALENALIDKRNELTIVSPIQSILHLMKHLTNLCYFFLRRRSDRKDKTKNYSSYMTRIQN